MESRAKIQYIRTFQLGGSFATDHGDPHAADCRRRAYKHFHRHKDIHGLRFQLS